MSTFVNTSGIPIPWPESFYRTLNDSQQTYINNHCNFTVCELSYAQVTYDPSRAGNEFFLAFWILILLIQVGLGVWKKTWTYLCTMIPGLLLEIVGWYARVGMSKNPWNNNDFLIYIVTLTVGPVFFTAALYVSFMRCIPLYDPSLTLNRLRPRNYIIVFVSFDFLSLVLQSAGGAIASGANTASTRNLGVNLLIAGLAVQVASLFCFIGLCSEFAFRIVKLQPQHRRAPITAGWKMKGFVYSIAIATIAIQIRSIFRVAELSGGFQGSLANDQVSLMILEGAMMAIAIISMTSFHPGWAVGETWFTKVGKGTHALIDEADHAPYVGRTAYNGGGLDASPANSAYDMGSTPLKTRDRA